MAITLRTCSVITLFRLVMVVPASCQVNQSVSRHYLQWEMFVPSDIHNHDKYSVLCVTTDGGLPLKNCADISVENSARLPSGFFGFILPSHNETGPIRTGTSPDLCWTPYPSDGVWKINLDHCTGNKEQDFMAMYAGHDAKVFLTWPSGKLNVHVGLDSYFAVYELEISTRTPHWFALRSEGLSWASPLLARALLLGSFAFSILLLFFYNLHLARTWIVSGGLCKVVLLKTLRMATLVRFLGRGAIDNGSEHILEVFIRFRIEQAQSSAYWALHLLVMPAAALELFSQYSSVITSLRSAIAAQDQLRSSYLLEGTLIMACIQFVVMFPRLVNAKSLDCINMFFTVLCMVSSLVRGSSISNDLDPFLVMLSFRIFYSMFCGNIRLTVLLQTAITLVELIGVDFVPYGTWVYPQATDIPLALSMLIVTVTLAWLTERRTLREATAIYQATVEKEIRERLLTVMMDGSLSVKRDEAGMFRISSIDSSASQLLGVAPDCSIVGEPIECLTPVGEDLVTVVREAEKALKGPALLREIRLATQNGQSFTAKSYVVGSPSGVTIALHVSDWLGAVVEDTMHKPTSGHGCMPEMLVVRKVVPEKMYERCNADELMQDAIALSRSRLAQSKSAEVDASSVSLQQNPDRLENMSPKVYGVRSSPAGDSRDCEEGSCPEHILNGSDVISVEDDACTFKSFEAKSHRGGQITGTYHQIKASQFPDRLSSALVGLQLSDASRSHGAEADLSSADDEFANSTSL